MQSTMSHHCGDLDDALLRYIKSDPSNIHFEEKLVHEISSRNASKGYLSEDAPSLLTAYKLTIQNWDMYQAKIPGYADLAMELGVALCNLAGQARDAEEFSKLFRNLQFVLAKCSKMEQNMHTLSLMDGMINLIARKFSEIEAISDCGKTIAFTLQSIGTYLVKKRQLVSLQQMCNSRITRAMEENVLVSRTKSDQDTFCLRHFQFMCNPRIAKLLQIGLSKDMTNQICIFVLDAAVSWISSLTASVASALDTNAYEKEVPDADQICELIDAMANTILAYSSDIRVDPFKFLDWGLRWQRTNLDSFLKLTDSCSKEKWGKLVKHSISIMFRVLNSGLVLTGASAELIFVWLSEIDLTLASDSHIDSSSEYSLVKTDPESSILNESDRRNAWISFHKLLLQSMTQNDTGSINCIEKFTVFRASKWTINSLKMTNAKSKTSCDAISEAQLSQCYLELMDAYLNSPQVGQSRLSIQKDVLSSHLVALVTSGIEKILAASSHSCHVSLARSCTGISERLESRFAADSVTDFEGIFRIIFGPLRHVALLLTGKLTPLPVNSDVLDQSKEFLIDICFPLIHLGTSALSVYSREWQFTDSVRGKSVATALASAQRVKGALLPLISKSTSSTSFDVKDAASLLSSLHQCLDKRSQAGFSKIFSLDEWVSIVNVVGSRLNKKYAESIDSSEKKCLNGHTESVSTKKKSVSSTLSTQSSSLSPMARSQTAATTTMLSLMDLMSKTLEVASDEGTECKILLNKVAILWGKCCIDVFVSSIISNGGGNSEIRSIDFQAIVAVSTEIAAVLPPSRHIIGVLSELPQIISSSKAFENDDADELSRYTKLLLAVGLSLLTDEILSKYLSNASLSAAIISVSTSNVSYLLSSLAQAQELSQLAKFEWGKLSNYRGETKIPTLRSTIGAMIEKHAKPLSCVVLDSITFCISSLLRNLSCLRHDMPRPTDGYMIGSAIGGFVTLFRWKVQIFGVLSENSEDLLSENSNCPLRLEPYLTDLFELFSSCSNASINLKYQLDPFSDDVELFFHILCALGRFDIQSTLLKVVSQCYDIDSTIEYLFAMHQLQMLCNGLVGAADLPECTERTTLVQVKSFVLESSSLLCLCPNVQANLIYSSEENCTHSKAVILSEVGSLNVSAEAFLGCEEAEFSFEEYIEFASKTIEAVSYSDIKENYRFSPSQLVLLRAWIHLCVAKCLNCCWSKYSMATEWAKKAVLLSKTTDASKSNSLVAPAELVVSFEGMLLIGEMHEQRGHLDKCYPYLADARSSAQHNCYGPHLLILYTLHTCRIWHRTGSSRLEKSLNLVRQIRSDAPWLRETSQMLLSYLDACKSADQSPGPAVKEISSFRNLRFTIDVASVNAIYGRFDCAMHPHVRSKLVSYLAERSNILSDISALVSVEEGSDLSEACATGEYLMCALRDAFEVTRVLSRRICSDALATKCSSPGLTNNWYAFKMLVSSIGPSIDLAEETEVNAVHANESFKETVQKRFDAAMKGYRLTSDCESNDSKYSAWNLALNCIALDKTSSKLLIGRYDRKTGAGVIALPICDSILSLVAEWDELMRRNVEQLTVTLNADVASWKDKEKKQWWEQRRSLDDGVQVFVDRLGEDLGIWRFMFAAPSKSPELYQTHHDHCRQILSQISWSKYKTTNGDKKKGVASKKIIHDDALPIYIASIASWISLILWNMSPEDLDSPLSVCEAKVAVEVLLQNGKNLSVTDCKEIADSIVSNFIENHCAAIASHSATYCNPSQEHAVHQEIDSLCEDLESLSVAELKSKLKSLSLPQTGKKADLIKRLQDTTCSKQEIETTMNPDKATNSDPNIASAANHIILMLDESLQNIPWENVSFLSQRQCSRSPNFSILLRLLASNQQQKCTAPDRDPLRPLSIENISYEKFGKIKVSKKGAGKKSSKVDDPIIESEGVSSSSSIGKLDRAWFCIDPEANLSKTRELLSTFLAPLASRWSWRGYAGECPPENTVRTLHEETDLFLYSGHGAGERLMDFSHFKQIKRCPSAFLWGCSSGRLRCSGVHDPYGGAVAYLLSGASFVVGNLWDVTDGDIDKLSMDCMGALFHYDVAPDISTSLKKKTTKSASSTFQENEWSESSKPASSDIRSGVPCDGAIAKAIVNARTVCKLRRAVGFAPVMYGIPVTIQVSTK